MILVLTTPRTGSTWYCDYLAKQHSLENLDEYFGEYEYDLSEQNQKLEYLSENSDVVFKCFPWHLKNIRNNFIRAGFLEHNLFKLADEIHILTRNDFHSQIKSFYIAQATGVWDGIPQELETVELDQNKFDYWTWHLKDGYMHLSEYYKKFDCKLMDFSELPFHTDTNKKYVRPIKWSSDPIIQDFNITELFKT